MIYFQFIVQKNFIKKNKKNKKLYISFVMRRKVGNAVKETE